MPADRHLDWDGFCNARDLGGLRTADGRTTRWGAVVLVHCAGGRDRTGLVCLLLLALAGVEPDEIADDYEASTERLRALYEREGFGDVAARVDALVARHGTTVRAAVLDTLASLDAEATMRAAGLGAGELAAVRARLLGPPLT